MAYIEAPAVQEGDSVINMDPSTKRGLIIRLKAMSTL